MPDQVDIAVDLGVVPPPLPEIEFLRAFAATMPEAPEQIVEGILHRWARDPDGGIGERTTGGRSTSASLASRGLLGPSGAHGVLALPSASPAFDHNRWRARAGQ